MRNKAERCAAEYYADDWGAIWHCDRPKGHTGWHTDKTKDEELIWSKDNLKGRKKLEVKFCWRRGEIEKYDSKTDTFK